MYHSASHQTSIYIVKYIGGQSFTKWLPEKAELIQAGHQKEKKKKEKVSKRKNIYINQVKIIIIKIYLAGRVDE